MNIKNSKVLVLGGWGLVGAAICHKLMEHSPAQLIVTSLRKSEAEEAVEMLRKEYPKHSPEMFVAAWGNIFTRNAWKDDYWYDVIADESSRKTVISDIFDELNDNILGNSALYDMMKTYKPDLVIDCINTATAIAYQDVYSTSNRVVKEISTGELKNETVEKMLASVYIPQLIRHIQIFYRSMLDFKTTMYIKVGTSGTGGMGLNIPYTHSEERPSRVLLAKAAIGGAMSLLLFLMARSPNGPLVKEIKPTAAIAWKKIGYDSVKRGGKPIELIDMVPENAKPLEGKFVFSDISNIYDLNELFKAVFIDTGENGIFSHGEFQAISSLGQMEMVTPEEIADCVVFEAIGGNSGHDIVQGLDAFTLGPTYRGGMLQNIAIKKIKEVEKQYGEDSVAFELLGPPRLSKLLYELYLIRRITGSMSNIKQYSADELSAKAEEIVKTDKKLRSQMLSIGLVILMSDGKNYLRGKEVKIPVQRTFTELDINEKNIENWCIEGWIDLRPKNFDYWKEIFGKIIAHAESVPDDDTSSRFTYNKDYWDNFESIDEGKIAGWMFEFEEKGWRFKR